MHTRPVAGFPPPRVTLLRQESRRCSTGATVTFWTVTVLQTWSSETSLLPIEGHGLECPAACI